VTSVPAEAVPVLFELHTAVKIAGPQLRRVDRARLDLATRAVLVAAGLGQLRLVTADRETLCAQLRRFIELAHAARVDWQDFVAIVNREWPDA
jgi:hypothetical protein